MKLIKMIWTSDVNCIFIYGMTNKEEIIFRASYNIKLLRTEKITLHENMCYFGAYNVHVSNLVNLPVLN